jgi:hypothetical protein
VLAAEPGSVDSTNRAEGLSIGYRRFGFRLTLAELETPPRPSLAVFLPLDHPRIPGKKAVVPQGNGITLVNLTERPRKPVPARAGLTIGTATVYVYKYIEFVFTGGYHKGLSYHHRMFTLGKIIDQIPAVYGNFAFSVPDVYPGNRCFAPARTDS